MKPNDTPVGVTLLDLVQQRHPLPFQPYPLQAEVINAMAPLPRSGLYAEVGTGKTVMATAIALHKLDQREADGWIVSVPPILIRQWYRWLGKIPGISAQMYRGTPKQRAEIELGADFIIMSMQMFKRDIERIDKDLAGRRYAGLIDEAQAIKNVESGNYQSVRDFFAGESLQLLTGTPLTTPADAYAYIKLIAPGIYKHQQQFLNLHVGERDFYNRITRWDRLDLLQKNFMVNAARIFKRDMLKDLPPVTYDPIHYDLEPAHYKIYKALADEALREVETDGLSNLTEGSLYQKLQQAVMNPGCFVGKPDMRATGYDLLDEVLTELNTADKAEGRKLLVLTWYKRTTSAVFQYLTTKSASWPGTPQSAVCLAGGMTDKQRDKAVETFVEDPNCRVMVMQPGAGGAGTDGLQYVCSDMLALELPITAAHFQQAVGRLDRTGQTRPVQIRAAVAEGTVQHRLWINALNQEELANRVQGSYQDLKEAVYGRG